MKYVFETAPRTSAKNIMDSRFIAKWKTKPSAEGTSPRLMRILLAMCCFKDWFADKIETYGGLPTGLAQDGRGRAVEMDRSSDLSQPDRSQDQNPRRQVGRAQRHGCSFPGRQSCRSSTAPLLCGDHVVLRRTGSSLSTFLGVDLGGSPGDHLRVSPCESPVDPHN